MIPYTDSTAYLSEQLTSDTVVHRKGCCGQLAVAGIVGLSILYGDRYETSRPMIVQWIRQQDTQFSDLLSIGAMLTIYRFPDRETLMYMETLPQNVMPSRTETIGMGRRRALLTDRERELIADPEAEDDRYVAVSRVRTKIQDELPEDVELLEKHHPQLFEELREVVCDE